MYDFSTWVYLFATSFVVAIAQNLAKRFIEHSDKKKKNTKSNHTSSSVEIRSQSLSSGLPIQSHEPLKDFFVL